MTAHTVVVHVDGQPITGHLPIDRWAAASLLAPTIAAITRQPVSVMAAAQPPTPGEPATDQLTIYDELTTTPP